MDEVVGLGLLLELQQRGAESIDLITGRLLKFDEVLGEVDLAIGSLDGRITALEGGFADLSGVADTTEGALGRLGSILGDTSGAARTLDDTLVSSVGAMNEYAASGTRLAEISAADADAILTENESLLREIDTLYSAAAANQVLAGTKGELSVAAAGAAEAIGALTGTELAEAAESEAAAASNQKMAKSKDELGVAAEGAKDELITLELAEVAEGEASIAAAGENQRLTQSKEEVAAAAAFAKAELLALAEAEAAEGSEAVGASDSNKKLAVAKDEVATAAQLAAQAERDLATAELLEAYEAIKDAGATDNLYMSKTQLINASRVEAATDSEVAEAELLEALALEKETEVRVAAIDAEIIEIRTLELLAAAEIEVANTNSLLATTGGEAAASTLSLTGAMAALGGSIKGVEGGAFLGFLGDIKGIAVDVAEALGIVAIAGGIADVAAVKWAADFQDSMIKVEALSGVTHAQMLQYSDDILGMSENTSISAKAMGDALYFISTGAYKGSAALDVLEVSQKAAAAGLGQTQVVADAVTSALTAYHKPTEDAAHVTDVLIQAVIEGKAEADSFAGSMGRFLPIMAASGISLEEGAASMATMTRVGLSAEESATALRQSINNLVAPTTQARKEMAALGLSTDDVRKMIADKGLLATYQKLIELTNGDMDAIRELIPNIRAMTGVLAEIGPSGDAYAEVLSNIRGSVGATDKAFEVAEGAISFQISRMINDIKSIGIEVGDSLIPELNPKIHEIGDWFIEQSHSVKTFLGSVQELREQSGLDQFTASLYVAGNSIGENFGPEAQSNFENVTKVIGDLAEGAGTSFGNIKDFIGENILPIPSYISAIFSADGGMAEVLTTLETAVGLMGEKVTSWVVPSLTDLQDNKLPALKDGLGSWFETEAPVLEEHITRVWLPAAVKWVELTGVDLATDKLPALAGTIIEWSTTKGVPALFKVGFDLAAGLTDGLTQGLADAIPGILQRGLVDPFQKVFKNLGNMASMAARGDFSTDPEDPFGDRRGDPSTREGRNADSEMIFQMQQEKEAALTLDDRIGRNIDAALTFMNQNAAIVDETTDDIEAAAATIAAARADMNTTAPTGHSTTARELAEQEAARKKEEAARKKAEAEQARLAKEAAAHDPLAGLMLGLRDNKQNYIDEYGKLGGALASALDETLQAGTTESGKKVATALEAQIGALRTAEIPEWRELGNELADAVYGSMADPKNLAALQTAQEEIGKINGLLEAAATAKQAGKFWDEWAKGGEEAANKINVAIETAAAKIEAAHEKAATSAQAAWDKLNLSRELDAAHDKLEGLMKDYETLRNSAKVDESRNREDTSTEQGRENQIQDIQLKRVNDVSDSEGKHQRALADLAADHVRKLADIRKDAHNKNMAIELAAENVKYQRAITDLNLKAQREETDRGTKWDREDSSRATSWSREDARRALTRAQQDADRLKEYHDADELKAYKLGLEQQFGTDKDTLRQAAYDKDIIKINATEQASIVAALADVDKITSAAETKLDALWDKLVLKYKGLFKAVTGDTSGEGGVGAPGTDYSTLVGHNGDTGSYVTQQADTTVAAHGKIIRAYDDEADSADDLSGSVNAVAGAQQGAAATAQGSTEATDRQTLANGDLNGSMEEEYARLNALNAAETERTNGVFAQIQAQGKLAAAYATTAQAASAAAAAQTQAANAPAAGGAGTLGNQAGGRTGSEGDPHNMSSTPYYPPQGYYFPSWIGTNMAGHQTNPTVAPPGTGAWNNGPGWLPKLADGGIVSKPMNVEVGEGGQSEMIAPLSDLPGLFSMMQPAPAPKMDLRELGQAIAAALSSAPLTAIVDPNQAVDAMAPFMFNAVRSGRMDLGR